MDKLVTSLDLTEYLALVGQDLPQPQQFNYEVGRDGIRHFADAIPDENALYADAEYAATTRWRGIIAPPGYLYAHGSPAWLGKLPGIKDATGRELEGSDNATESWEFFKPVRPGDIVMSYGKIASATPKRSRKLGECVLVTEEMRFTNQRGEVVARLNSLTFRFDAEAASDAGQIASAYPPMPPGQYTRNVMTAPLLPGTYEPPVPRYDANRFFEDVEIGETVTPWEFGPLMVFDIGRFNAATIGTGNDRIGRIGHVPDAFAPGVLRIQWFGTMLSRWAGPDAWTTKIQQRNEEWVLVGFKIICGGTVTGKSIVDGRCLVDLDIWCKSELGFRTNSGVAQVEMPSRTHPFRAR
jgi:acyl dehydratase